MAEESKTEEKREEEKEGRQDADAKLDRIAAHLDSLHKRMDSYEKTREDAEDEDEEKEEKEEEEKKDSRRKDSKRKDSSRKDSHRKDSRHKDAEDEGEDEREDSDADEDDSEHEEKESERAALKKERGENELKEKDSVKKDSEKKEDSRQDSQPPAWASTLTDRLAAIETHMKDAGTEDRSKFAAIWNQDEKLCQLFGDSTKGTADRWWPGESLGSYARRIASKYKKYSEQWKDVDLAKQTDDVAFAKMAVQIYNDAESAAMRGAAAAPGRLQRVEVIDPYSHARRIEWRGDDDGASWHVFANIPKFAKFATPTKS